MNDKYIIFIDLLNQANYITTKYQNNISVEKMYEKIKWYCTVENIEYDDIEIFYNYKNINIYKDIEDFSKNKTTILYYKIISVVSQNEKNAYEKSIEQKDKIYDEQGNKKFDIFYKSLKATTELIKCCDTYTIGELKYLISKKENIHMKSNTFIFAGLSLKNNDIILKNTNIKKESTIHLALNINTQPIFNATPPNNINLDLDKFDDENVDFKFDEIII